MQSHSATSPSTAPKFSLESLSGKEGVFLLLLLFLAIVRPYLIQLMGPESAGMHENSLEGGTQVCLHQQGDSFLDHRIKEKVPFAIGTLPCVCVPETID